MMAVIIMISTMIQEASALAWRRIESYQRSETSAVQMNATPGPGVTGSTPHASTDAPIEPRHDTYGLLDGSVCRRVLSVES